MSGAEPPAAGPESRPAGRGTRLALWALIAVGAAAVLYVMAASSIKPGRGEGLERFAKGSLEKLRVPEAPQAAPSVAFLDERGERVRIADLPGDVVVVNLWATWCAPCVTEMPTLAALQKAYPGRVNVVTISMDTVPNADRARAFLAEHPPLKFHHDPTWGVSSAIKPVGLPATLIYGRDRVERARLFGAAEWDSPEARALFDALLADQAPERASSTRDT